MPMLELTLAEDALEAQTRSTVVDGLTAALLRAEGVLDNATYRDVAWAYVHELAGDDLYIGGRRTDRPIIRLDVTVPDGAFSQQRRTELISETNRLIRHAAGIDESETSRSVWVLIHEIPEGSWGADGKVVNYQGLCDGEG